MDQKQLHRPARSGGGALVYLAVLATVGLLWVARDLLIPIAVALMVWVLLRALADAIGRLRWRGFALPAWSRIAAALAVVGLGGWLLVRIVARNAVRVQEQAPAYQANLTARLDRLAKDAGVDYKTQVEHLLGGGEFNFMGWVGTIAGELSSLAGSLGLVLIYLLFLLVEQRYFPVKLASLVPDGTRRDEVAQLIARARSQIESYVVIKFGASALTGGLSWGVLAYLGVDFAAFWGLVIFLLNFIPTIGSIVGVLLPLALILVQFPEPLRPFVIALVGLGAVQFLIGNVLEPRWTSGSLDLSPLALLLSLAVWGKMWGIVGMFLSVPLTVILAIGCSEFPRTRWITVLLSERGGPARVGRGRSVSQAPPSP